MQNTQTEQTTQAPAPRMYRVVGYVRNKTTPVILFPGPLTHDEACRCKAALTPHSWRTDMLEELPRKA